MEVWNPEHPHHSVWRDYTQSLLGGKPKVVRSRMKGSVSWMTGRNPEWDESYEYEIARPMLKLIYEVPMPVTEALEDGQEYWRTYVHKSLWANDEEDMRRLSARAIYLTEADAQAAIDARNAAMTAALEGAK